MEKAYGRFKLSIHEDKAAEFHHLLPQQLGKQIFHLGV